jgi:hypothetical protein
MSKTEIGESHASRRNEPRAAPMDFGWAAPPMPPLFLPLGVGRRTSRFDLDATSPGPLGLGKS